MSAASRMLALIALLGVLCVGAADPSARPRLLVYLQTSMTASSLQKSLAKELPETDVLVLSRFKDFERALVEDRPDAVIALCPVLEQQALKPELIGALGGHVTEKYVVMTLEQGKTAATDLGGKTIGAVDVLGRKRMSELVSKLLRSTLPLKINPVIKEDDLLPLLQFKAADAIFLPERIALEFRKNSLLALSVVEGADAEVGLACASFLTQAGRERVRPAMTNMTAGAKKQLGVEAWK